MNDTGQVLKPNRSQRKGCTASNASGRSRDLVHVPGAEMNLLGLQVDRQLGRVDGLVAPQAPVPRDEGPDRDVDSTQHAVVVDGDLHADLYTGDEVLVDDLVDEVAGGVRVGGQEDVVAI